MEDIKTTTEQIMQQIKKHNELFDSMARYSRMPIRTFESHRLWNFLPSKGIQPAYDAALLFIGVKDGVPQRQHHFLTFAGECGRGKTHLVFGIGWHWLEQGMGVVLYYQVEQLLDDMRAEFDRPEPDNPKRSIMDKCTRASLLILDDLGAEKTSPFTVAKLDELVDHRYLQGLPTLFTTNLAPKKLPPRVASRLKEGVTVPLDGPDYRDLIAKRRKGVL